MRVQDQDGYSALGAHVDDLLGVGDDAGLQKIADTLTTKFEITMKRNPTIVTGVQIQCVREKRWLKLHQGAFITRLLADYQMSDCNSTDTPMDPGTARALMLLPIDSGPRCPEEISTSRGVPHLASKDPTRYDVYRESPLPILEERHAKALRFSLRPPPEISQGHNNRRTRVPTWEYEVVPVGSL